MNKSSKLLVLAVAGLMTVNCYADNYEYPFQNPKLKTEKRVDDLMSRLTPEEKVGLIMNKSISVDRLGIPSYNWWSEACHGVRQGNYTVFPQPIGMGASFNPDLVYEVFDAVSDEARANWNRSNHDIFGVEMGANYVPGNPELTFWCPNVNIFRDPRWGRGQEAYGEDPYHMGVMGVANVKGMQGNDKKYYKTHACAKHYAVHSGPEQQRHRYNASVSMRDLWETYLPAFKKLVQEGNVQEVMCAYNRYEGEPCCGSDRLLTNILREKWGYEAIVLTDCDAINNFYNKNQHGTHPDAVSASVDAVLSGTDLECGKAFMSLVGGLQDGKINEADIDVALRRVLTGRFELGMFDPAEMLPWANLGEDVISSEKNDQLAIEAARQSMVLLKNNGVLPLDRNIRKLAVLGPNADDAGMMNGEYGGSPTKEHTRTLLDGIRANFPNTEIVYDKACEIRNEYYTTYYTQDLNAGQGFKAEFWNNTEFNGEPAVTGFYKEVNFSTFGAYNFADGVEKENISVRLTGKLKAPFTGDMNYSVSGDNGFRLYVNGELVEEQEAAAGGRGGFGGFGGFGFGGRGGQQQMKSFPVEAGQEYDVKIEYSHATGQFARLSAQICKQQIAEFTDLAAKLKAQNVDAIIIIGGITPSMEGEGGDKPDIEIPAVQQRLVRAMHATGKPVIFVDCAGSCMGFGSIEDQFDALIQAWYPGQGGAQALGEILNGECNPSAKLTVTFYKSTDQLPDFEDYSMEGRTYRYFHGEPLYPFGYGLSYTTYKYGQGKLSKASMKKNGKVTITIPVTNTGKVDGTEIVQVYVKSLDNPAAPIKGLQGFQRVSLKAGETADAVITLTGENFQYYDEKIDEVSTFSGRYQILYGPSSADKDLQSLDFQVL
ncbi:MAG: glycoside hydrolase family 3 C-terminal domain-containing protein [Bacteroidaceae bacterium]|nr:glycoside hydrolase family 3 C-terminal domain-containing protein [Bacteroidaceae bacterium]